MEIESSLPHTKVPATFPILRQIDPVHAHKSHVLEFHINIIFPSTEVPNIVTN